MKAMIQKVTGFDDKNAWKKQYFLIYTVLFAITAFLVFSWFFLTGKTFIRRNGDGWNQHYKALVYYGSYLRSIISSFFSGHGLVIPAWDFSIGEGSDILGTLNYYVMGDPFAFFSFLVPTRFMHIFYEAMILLRMYLSGIAFSCLCFHTGQKSRYAVMAGTMTYVFCFWAIYNSTKHPYFLNPMLFFPLLILGVEKILKKQRPHVFIAAVCLSAVSNFYFFYMLVLATVFYVLVRVIFLYRKEVWPACKMVVQIGAYAVVGVLLAAVVFLPVCYVFLTNPRMSTGGAVGLFYPLSFYVQFPALFVAAGAPEYTCMGFAVPTLIAVFFLFYRRKEYVFQKVLFVSCVVIFMVPYLGHALNGFSYAANRWSFAFAPLCAYILTIMWPSLMKLNKKETIFLGGCAALYFLYCLLVLKFCLGELYRVNIAVAAVLALAFLILLFPGGAWGALRGKGKQRLGMLLVIVSILNSSYWQYSPAGNHDVNGGIKAAKINKKLTSNETKAVKRIAKKDGNSGFYRYSGSDLTTNAGMIAGLSSTQFYWTLSNPYTVEFKRALELPESNVSHYKGYRGRAGLLSLSSVGYYAIPAKKPSTVPYGFSLANKPRKYEVYRNDYTLPLAYTYDTYLPADQWDRLTAVDKEDALLQSLVLEEGVGGFKEGTPVFESTEIPYTLTCKGDVLLQDHAITVTSKEASVTLEFEGLADSETLFSIAGLSFQELQTEDGALSDDAEKVILKLRSSMGTEKKLGYPTEKALRYNDRHDFTVDFGYEKETVSSIKIEFSNEGIYHFDSIHVTGRSMDSYGAWIAARKVDTLEHMELAPNTVTGTISLDEPKLLCLAIPYAEGWRAYVDGKEAELLRANVQYMALALDAGEHEIRLAYATPLLKEGACITLITFLVLAVLMIVRKRRDTYHYHLEATDYTEYIYNEEGSE